MYEFSYHKAASLKDALEVLKASDDGKLLAGGMTLLPTMKQRLAAPDQLVDLAGLSELTGIEKYDDHIVIGAMTRHAEVVASELVESSIPALAALAELIGDPQVRNRGTLGGSVANSDPAADYPAAVLGLNASIVTDKRTIEADNFFVDLFETELEEHEIITSVRFPIPDTAAYMKFPNPASRYAVAGVFVARFGSSVRVAVTGAGGCVFRQSDMEQALESDFSAAALDGIDVSSDDLNEDIHASAEYRAHLVGVMAKRAVSACLVV
ncbi:carbon monoxide dehydrogenase [Chromatiales bacterium (ex Bugula neritina AB1)]|nr:carbon monoxide dehydrogenase [Chromatiales bacterium (ex Bugula neritina AB1)]